MREQPIGAKKLRTKPLGKPGKPSPELEVSGIRPATVAVRCRTGSWVVDARAGSSVRPVGSAAAELFALVVTPPLERGRATSPNG